MGGLRTSDGGQVKLIHMTFILFYDVLRIAEMFDERRFIADEDSINIAFKLPRTEDKEASRQPTMTKLRMAKVFSKHSMLLTQKVASDTREDFFGILRLHLSSDSVVQFLAVEEDHEVVNLRNRIYLQ